MDIIFYYNNSDNRCLNKILLPGETISGTLRQSSSMINPVIKLEKSATFRYNYAYISEFRRYYFITNTEVDFNKIRTITFKVDPLMSFKQDILNLKVVVDKQASESNGDEYIDDSSLVTNNLTFNSVYNFPDGFNDGAEYILITAG